MPYAFNLTMTGGTFGNWYNIWLYGSNNASDFNDITDINVSGNMILLYTFTYSGSNWTPSMGYILLTTSYSFRYYLLLASNYGANVILKTLAYNTVKITAYLMVLITLYQHHQLLGHLLLHTMM